MTKIEFPSWRQRLARSLHINRSQPQSKYFQVASVSPHGLPSNRTMVFRGFLPDSLDLVSVTDIRSDKIKDWQIQADRPHHQFEICWYFAGSREQYRISGKLSLLSKSAYTTGLSNSIKELDSALILKEYWNKLSTKAQAPFLGPSPKAPFDDPADTSHANDKSKESQKVRSENSSSADASLEMSDNFCVVIFTPQSVDYLSLKAKPQLRCLSDANNVWKEEIVVA